MQKIKPFQLRKSQSDQDGNFVVYLMMQKADKIVDLTTGNVIQTWDAYFNGFISILDESWLCNNTQEIS